MRKTVIAIAFMLITGITTSAQQGGQGGPDEPKLYTSASDITALIAKAKADRKGDAPMVPERILRLAPYSANLEYRASVGPAAVHIHEAEFFYVIDGAATMVTGGKLVEQTQNNPENLAGKSIEGGDTRNIAKGDFIVVPENTPHWISNISQTLVLMTLHVPRPVPGK